MDSQTEAQDVVRRMVTVAASQQRAFEVFAEEFGTWWPAEYHIGAAEMADFIVEPRVGGRWYEVDVDGTECDTGRVVVYDPPHRLTLAWHLDGAWQYDPDPAHASEVEVRFVAEAEDRTRVELEHRHFERHGDGAAAVRGAIESPSGWDFCLTRYAERMAA